MLKKVCSILCYLVALIFLCIYIVFEILPNTLLQTNDRLILLCGSCLFLYFGGLILSKIRNNNKPMKINLWIFFILYLLLFITLTLFDESWGRNGILIVKWSRELFNSYIQNNLNLIPFKTIIGYLKEFNSLYSTNSILYNLLGNFVACMPFAFFLPLLFKKQNKSKNFLITIILIVLGIELTQFITLSGRCDIDDFILNVSGAIIFYFLIKIKSVNNLLRNIFLLEHNKIKKKSVIKIIVIFVLIIISVFAITTIRNKLYDNNMDEYNKIYNPTVTFEYDDTCSEDNLFYEDEVYKYYFECYNKNDFYVIVNDEEKFTINDLLDNSKYNMGIDRILEIMEVYNIKYKKENKHPHLNLEFNVGNYGYSLDSVTQNEYVKVILKDVSEQNGIVVEEANIIPIKEGITTIKINLDTFDNEGNTIKTIVKKLEISIDENLNVSYKELS